MKNWIIKSNKWFDELEEPFRFLLFIIGCGLPILVGLMLIRHEVYWFLPLFIVTLFLWRIGGTWLTYKKVKKPLTKSEKLLLRAVEEIHHLKYKYKDRGHAEKFLKDVEDYFKK